MNISSDYEELLMDKTENTMEDLIKKQQNENRLLQKENELFRNSINELNYECYKLENILEKIKE